MPKFDAAKVVEPLDYDFTHFPNGTKGTIPEPSPEILTEFLREVTKIVPDLAKSIGELGPDAKEEEIFAVINRLRNSDILEAVHEKMLDIYSRVLCQGTPTVDEIKVMPLRYRQAFFAWLLEEIRPEVFGAAITPSRPALSVVRGA